MKIRIGDNIKKQRLLKKQTQENLSEVFDVSPQAISRWENESTFPDIQLLPTIANYFQISVDELLGVDEMRSHEQMCGIYTRVHNFELEGSFEKAVAELRKALKVFPRDFGFMSELALALTMSNNKNNNKAYDEAINLSNDVLKNSVDDKVRSTTKANLCYLHQKVNDHSSSVKTAGTLSHVWESRELITPEVVDQSSYEFELKKGLLTTIDVLYEKIKFDRQSKINTASKTLALGRREIDKIDVLEKLDAIKLFMT